LAVRFQYSLTVLLASVTFCAIGSLLVRQFGWRGLAMFVGAAALSTLGTVITTSFRTPRLVGIVTVAAGGLGSLIGESWIEKRLLDQPLVLLIGIGLGGGIWLIAALTKRDTRQSLTHALQTAVLYLVLSVAVATLAYCVSGQALTVSESLPFIIVGLTAGGAIAFPYLCVGFLSQARSRSKP